MFPVAIAQTAQHEPAKAVDRGGHVDLIVSVWCLARVALVALTVALEIALNGSGNLRLGNGGSYLGAITYVGVIVGVAGLLHRLAPARGTGQRAD